MNANLDSVRALPYVRSESGAEMVGNLKRALVFGCVIFTTQVFASGHESSGGGAATVCRDHATQKITKAELLDLYEGKTRFGYSIPKFSTKPHLQVATAIAKLNSHAAYKPIVTQIAELIRRRIEFLPPGVVLAPPTDLGSSRGIVVPAGCVLEGVGFYESDGVLKVSADIYKKLSKTDQAALLVHEAIYRIARSRNQDNSEDSRQLTAMIFSNNVTSPKVAALAHSLIDMDAPYDMHPYFVEVAGEPAQIRIKLKPSDAKPYSVSFFCEDLSWNPLQKPIEFSGSGDAELLLDASLGCSYINGRIWTKHEYGGTTPELIEVEYSFGSSIQLMSATKSAIGSDYSSPVGIEPRWSSVALGELPCP